ncbi:hypothetical protein ABB37_06763 [Leptomonas pyrrhocoris]|uniref:Arrestin-like N-terminal domain-containing protein n=1 Tax=Leptomonas pyrrhocoris TaxID=157538 RepID=A0A0N0VED4_LEPPY|nr:hypothetical protein ABB37_06763 [Leptomonas pyrrhocoris]KPA78002.1 hypothetical protein ABB37_06763 [Leptomonas pyrrhocoris]|eukprot:XP_015656441.1 hypothetical protein ABB37_06763 [Leptomonas pyrrhocoris]
MPFLEKDKIVISLSLERDGVMPGERVTGCVNVVVIEEIKFSTLRVHVVGEEMMYRRRERYNQLGPGGNSLYNSNGLYNNNNGLYNNNNQLYSTSSEIERSTHSIIDRYKTLLGQQTNHDRPGSFHLEPGNYSYPFSILLPTDLPPTYSVQECDYGGHIKYTVKAVVDIPMGFDGKAKAALMVYKMAPLSQVFAVRAAPVVVRPVCSEIGTIGCGGFFCGHEENSYLRTMVMITPNIAVLNRSVAATFPPSTAAVPRLLSKKGGVTGPAPPPIPVPSDPSVITVRVLVDNRTKSSAVAAAQVKLTQHLSYSGGIHHSFCLVNRVIGFESGVLRPGQSTAVDCSLNLGTGGGSTAAALPTFSAHYVRVWTSLEVTYPHVKADDTLYKRDLIHLVTGIDATNTASPV